MDDQGFGPISGLDIGEDDVQERWWECIKVEDMLFERGNWDVAAPIFSWLVFWELARHQDSDSVAVSVLIAYATTLWVGMHSERC